MFESRTVIALLLICGILPAHAQVNVSPSNYLFTTIGPGTPGVIEYEVTLAPTGTPGLYASKLTLVPVGTLPASLWIGDVPLTPGRGCFAGGECSSSDPSAFSFLQFEFSPPVAGFAAVTNGTSEVFISLYDPGGTWFGTGAALGSLSIVDLSAPYGTHIVQVGGWAEPVTLTSVAFAHYVPTPEPNTLLLFATALGALCAVRRRKLI